VEALYGPNPGWLLIDPNLRVMGRAPLDAPQALFRGISELPPPAGHAGVPLVAPVLVVPRVFDPAFCRELIAYYDAQGGQVSGVMRDIDGRTVGVLDGMKRRRDVNIVDEGLKAGIIEGLERALAPMIERTFHFRATRLERYLIACYDAEEGGYFRPHRDNQSFATAHRKFAVSINLNAEEFEGGDLRFPEFGPRTYRPPTGGAVVFCCSLLHEATPVTRGRRYAVLPFLYDAAGEAIRKQNIDKLQVGPALVLDR
jgi:predicted 2-oxoglutarate/Fe(II)-dependent dioxygenase YbiX